MSITPIASIPWSGNLPGYAAVAGSFWACAVPNAGTIRLSTGETIALPAPVNDVRVSRGGKWAWQRHDTGDIYEGLTRVGPGFGRNSFLYVGETLRLQPEAFPPDQGWAYVDASGSIVTFGAFYSHPPLANAVQYPDVWIGQGQESGCCVYVPGETAPRLLLAGNCDFFSVDRIGEAFTIAIVNDAAHLTTILAASLGDLTALPFVHASVPLPAPSPAPAPEPVMSVPDTELARLDASLRARASLLTPNADCRPFIVAVANDLGGRWGLNGKRGNATDPSKDVLDYLDASNTVWLFDVIGDATDGSGPGANTLNIPTNSNVENHPNGDGAIWIDPKTIGGEPTSAPIETPTPPPAPSPDLTPLLADVAALKVRISALENAPQPQLPDLSAYAKHGDAVTVTGHMTLNFFGASVKTQDATLTGTITK